MIQRPLTLPATAWERGAKPPKTMTGGHGVQNLIKVLNVVR